MLGVLCDTPFVCSYAVSDTDKVPSSTKFKLAPKQRHVCNYIVDTILLNLHIEARYFDVDSSHYPSRNTYGNGSLYWSCNE